MMRQIASRRLRALAFLALPALFACTVSRNATVPRVYAIGIVRFASADPPRLARWYQDNLGFPAPTEMAGGVLKGELSTPWGPLSYTIDAVSPGQPVPTTELDLKVSDIEGFVDRLTKAGYPPTRRSWDEEGKSAWFRDPDGNTVRLTQP